MSLDFECHLAMEHEIWSDALTGSDAGFTENSHIHGIGTLVLIGQACTTATFRNANPIHIGKPFESSLQLLATNGEFCANRSKGKQRHINGKGLLMTSKNYYTRIYRRSNCKFSISRPVAD